MTGVSGDISVYVQARKGSRRCANKMLRPFAGTTLVDLCLGKLNDLRDYPVFFAVGEADEEFHEIACKYPNIRLLTRSQESVDSPGNPRLVFEAYKRLPTPEVCFVNACHSFLKIETIVNALKRFSDSRASSLTSVTRRKGWYYSEDYRPLTNLGGAIDTVVSDSLYEVAHAFHIYNWSHMLETGRYWGNGDLDPLLFEIPELEALDIDTENEFTMVEALYRTLMA